MKANYGFQAGKFRYFSNPILPKVYTQSTRDVYAMELTFEIENMLKY